MPLTFIDIEKQKNWRIGVLFLFLFLLYFIITLVVVLSFRYLFLLELGLFPGFSSLIIIFTFSVLIASMHFVLNAYNAVDQIKKSLGVIDPDPEDGIHKRLMNIMHEIHVVTGNKRKIQCSVMPTLSMNALSAVDLNGNALITITEGLLSRLSRSQLEAVMAHEAHHILSGDCMETTISASLFGIPSAGLERIQMAYEGRMILHPAFILIWLLVKFSYLLNMFISREREYRADAGAVRMTRNPIALAEVLYLLSRNWRGSGFIGRGLEMLCMVNPTARRLDESEGIFSNLMSTHPPIKKRIKILLKIAHAGLSVLKRKGKKTTEVKHRKASESVFYALDNQYQWQGPYSLGEILLVPWLTPLTWISEDGKKVKKASKMPFLNVLFRERVLKQKQLISKNSCPSCHSPLVRKSYEKTTVEQCTSCGGTLVENTKIPRIIARKGVKYSGRIKALSRTTIKENQLKRIARHLKKEKKKKIPLLKCPKCKNRMWRTFYSLAYLIELDRCSYCGITWFDYDELEMIQCMIDNKMTATSVMSQN